MPEGKNPISVATFGSCLSRYSVNALQALRPVDLRGVVYHNRIDRFVDHYVQDMRPEPSEGQVSALIPVEGAAPRLDLMISNQLSGRGLGHHSLHQKIGFMEAIKQPLDLVVLDNFVDIVAKLARFKGEENTSLFINYKDVENAGEHFVMEREFLPVSAAIDAWHKLLNWVRAKQPAATILFLNFPMQHHPSEQMRNRSEEFYRNFKSDHAIVLPPFPVHQSLVETPSHFSPMQYTLFSGALQTAIEAPDFLLSTTINDADAVLRAKRQALSA